MDVERILAATEDIITPVAVVDEEVVESASEGTEEEEVASAEEYWQTRS